MAEAVDSTPEEAEDTPVQYPLTVEYCGICTMPPEYCGHGPAPAKCYEWMKENLPRHYARLVEGVEGQLGGLAVGDGKRQTRGGKAMKKLKKKEVTMKFVEVSRATRSKKKCVTMVVGLKTFEIDLKKASKTFAQHFSCGSAVTGDDEIVIQGDVGYDVIDFIQEKWPDVGDDAINFVGDHKK